MPDGAVSTDPAVQRQLDRLNALGPGADILGLDRITRLLDRLGNPHLDLPPVFHVAGTNGKGSTCAFLRAALEADGKRVHVFTSPHLVRFNERIRLAGDLIDDVALAALLEEVLDRGGDIGASFFEVTAAAAFLAFSRTPADACVIEVGLGGRLDATNVVTAPAACGIAQLGIDHQAFLGDTLEQIAGEKAGIAKPARPLATMQYVPSVAERVAEVAGAAEAVPIILGRDWHYDTSDDRLTYCDARGTVETPLPALPGPHQPANLALAIAMLRHQREVEVSDHAFAIAARTARWPARMQRLAKGPLTALLPADVPVWLDGGHNEAAGMAIARAMEEIADISSGRRRPVILILGMLANKDVAGLLGPLAPLADALIGVPVPDHVCHEPAELARQARTVGIGFTTTAHDVENAMEVARTRCEPDTPRPIVLIAGSLYLAGEVLRANGELPD